MAANLLCQRCNKEFTAQRSDALWCPECRLVRAKERTLLYETKWKDKCPDCGKPMVRRAEYCLRCSNKRRGEKRRAENNGAWRGGFTKSEGYILRRVAHKSGQGAYRPEHHLVWEENHGQALPKGWIVHHLNGIKDDNRPENLLALPRGEHHKHPFTVLQMYQSRIRQLEEFLRRPASAA